MHRLHLFRDGVGQNGRWLLRGIETEVIAFKAAYMAISSERPLAP